MFDGSFDCFPHGRKNRGPELVRSRVMRMQIDLQVNELMGRVWWVGWMAGWVAGWADCWVDGFVANWVHEWVGWWIAGVSCSDELVQEF